MTDCGSEAVGHRKRRSGSIPGATCQRTAKNGLRRESVHPGKSGGVEVSDDVAERHGVVMAAFEAMQAELEALALSGENEPDRCRRAVRHPDEEALDGVRSAAADVDGRLTTLVGGFGSWSQVVAAADLPRPPEPRRLE